MTAEVVVGIVGLGITFVGAVLGATWVLSEKLGDMKSDIKEVATKVELILTNHLVHLQEDMTEVKDEQKRLRDKIEGESY